MPILKFDRVCCIRGEVDGYAGGFVTFARSGVRTVLGNRRLMGVLLLYWGLGISRISYAYYTPYIIDNVISMYPRGSHHTLVGYLNLSLLVFIAGNSLLVGRLITRLGHRFALIIGAAGLVASNSAILVSHTFVAAIIGQYFLSIFMLCMYLASLNAQMDFAPHEDRSTISAL